MTQDEYRKMVDKATTQEEIKEALNLLVSAIAEHSNPECQIMMSELLPKLHGDFALRKWSWMNPWIDFTVFVPANKVDEAEEALSKAYNAYWDGDYECYGDAIDEYLSEAVDRYEIVYIDDIGDYDSDRDDGDNPEYERWFKGLDCPSSSEEWR